MKKIVKNAGQTVRRRRGSPGLLMVIGRELVAAGAEGREEGASEGVHRYLKEWARTNDGKDVWAWLKEQQQVGHQDWQGQSVVRRKEALLLVGEVWLRGVSGE